MIIGICIVGIVINWIMLGAMADAEPEGAMGMAIFLPLAFIPFLFPIGWALKKIYDLFQ